MVEIFTDLMALTGTDVVSYVHEGYKRAKLYHQRNYNNCVENWRFYWGKNPELGLGQWPAKSIAKMMQQGRQLLTYNFIMPTVDAIAGGIMQVPFDPDFIPIFDGKPDPEIIRITEGAKKAMHSDKELLDWKAIYLQIVVHGLIHEGVIKIAVSNEYNKLGNVGFEICLPGSVISDPQWKDWGAKTLKKVWHETWHTTKQLMELYPEHADRLRYEAKKESIKGDQYGANTGIIPFATTDDRWGSMHRLIEQYDVKEEKVKTEWVVTGAGDIEIPKMPDDEKPKWLNDNIRDWNWDFDRIYETEDKEKTCYVSAECQELLRDELLQDGKTEVQIGCTPFKFWSASRHNGEPHSIVDSIKDAQINLNYGESTIRHKIQTEGGGGSQFADETMFASLNGPGGYKDYEKNRNNPQKIFKVKPGYMQKGLVPAKPTTNTTYPREIYANIEHIIERILPITSKTTPTTLARTESGTDPSGRLFRMLKIQADQLVYTIHYGLRVFWNESYEGYLRQAYQTYSNENIPRYFQKGKETTILNEVVGGEVKNDISKLKNIRHKIIISEKQESPTEKMDNIATLSAHMERLPEEAIASRAVITSEINNNIEQFSSETREKLKVAGEVELNVALDSLKLQKSKIGLEQTQIDAALERMQQGTPALPAPSAGAGAKISEAEVIEPETPQATASPPPMDTGSEPITEGAFA